MLFIKFQFLSNHIYRNSGEIAAFISVGNIT